MCVNEINAGLDATLLEGLERARAIVAHFRKGDDVIFVGALAEVCEEVFLG